MGTSSRRDEIMQAALELIAEKGFHAAPMAEIAGKAGVAAGTIYRYFESKEELIGALYRELEGGMMAFLERGYPADRPLRERFLYLIRALLRYLVAEPLHFRYMEQYFNSPYGISLRRDRLLGNSGCRDPLMDVFEIGIGQQILKELPRVVLFSLAFGPLISLMRDHLQGLVTLEDALIDKVAQACWDAIKR